MITSPLLSNVSQRALVLCLVRSFILARVTGQFMDRSLAIILEIGAVHWIGLQIQCSIPGVGKLV